MHSPEAPEHTGKWDRRGSGQFSLPFVVNILLNLLPLKMIALVATSLLPSIETLTFSSYYQIPVRGQVGWFQTGFSLRHNIFANHPKLERITFTRHEDIFQWHRRDFVPKMEPAMSIFG